MTEVRSTADLRDAFRARVRDLGIAYETVDAIAGLPVGYTGKLLGANPSRNFGAVSFDSLLGALGLKLVAVEDTEALARVQGRLVPIRRSAASRQEITVRMTRKFLKEIGRQGGRKSGEVRAAAAARKRAISERNRAKAFKRWHTVNATATAAPGTPHSAP
jgi:hypothetical protein